MFGANVAHAFVAHTKSDAKSVEHSNHIRVVVEN